jgi:hypothetical protein
LSQNRLGRPQESKKNTTLQNAFARFQLNSFLSLPLRLLYVSAHTLTTGVSMTLRRGVQIASVSLPIHAPDASEGGGIELVVLYTGPETTAAVLERAVHLTAGLNATVTLVAVCAVPYQSPFGCPLAVRSTS